MCLLSCWINLAPLITLSVPVFLVYTCLSLGLTFLAHKKSIKAPEKMEANKNTPAQRIPLIQAIHFKGIFLGLHFMDLFVRSVFGTYSCPIQSIIGIAMIVLGSINIENCPMDPGLPLFLVIYGVLFLCFCYLRRPCKRDDGARAKRIWNLIEAVVGVLLFVATICFGFLM